ncbi:MAG TPA: alpha/beta hydrolase [Saccharofermentans sp.]|nr:alpha/beta hydrolase [Saccharofermentans sp.]
MEDDNRFGVIRERKTSSLKKIIRVIVAVFALYFLVVPAVIAIIHGVVMRNYSYEDYDANRFLVYADIASQYPREEIQVESGDHNISAYLYGVENSKGLIVVAPGHSDSNDIKLYEVRYFVDAGYQVLGFDYSGYYTSDGDFGGYTQAVYDLDAILSYCDDNERFNEMPIYLFGHSLGGYAVTAVLNFDHRVDAVVSASGFNSASEQWECSIQRFTGWLYPIISPMNRLFIDLEYGEDRNLSAVDGINNANIPVLVISADVDVFYNGNRSPIYEARDSITNENCEFILMDEEGHNEHYSYFLTDAALEYQESKPTNNIDRELYMEHDDNVMLTIIEFYTSH